MPDDQESRLIEAWKTWDEKSTDDRFSNLLEDEVQVLSRSLGMDSNELRIAMVDGRKRGLTYKKTVDNIVRHATRQDTPPTL